MEQIACGMSWIDTPQPAGPAQQRRQDRDARRSNIHGGLATPVMVLWNIEKR
jgi:hypothetical protein